MAEGSNVDNTHEEIPLKSIGSLFYDSLTSTDLNRISMIDHTTQEEITNGEFLQMTINLAQKLTEMGISKGDVVTVISRNSVRVLATVVSALYIGAQVNLLNPEYLAGEIKLLLSISKPKVIFCESEPYDQLKQLKQETFYPPSIFVYDSISCNELFSIVKTRHRFTPVQVDAKDVAFIMSSSGTTTGLPKCVALTHVNVRASFVFYGYPYTNFTEEDTILAILPFFHIFGVTSALARMFYGTKLIIMSKFVPERFLKAIEEYRISVLFTVPPLLQFFLKSPLVDKYDLSSIRVVYSGAASLSKENEEAILEKLKIKSIYQGYGLTETTGVATVVPPFARKFGSVGIVCRENKIRICDVESGKALSANQVGELRIKGDSVMKGYLGNEEATKEAFDEEGYLKTGDLAYFDEEHFYFIVGRLKEIIKYKGFQVSPIELETILFEHPSVEDCAVIGVPNEDTGEVPLAFVVRRPNEDISEAELLQYVNEKVSVQKRLHGGLRFIEKIPKSASGKILRRLLLNIELA